MREVKSFSLVCVLYIKVVVEDVMVDIYVIVEILKK